MDQPQRELPSSRQPNQPWWTRRQRGWTIVLLFAGCMAYSFVRTPIPAVNEPHYLTKAKHVWNPAWGRGDLFLESSNPHFVFYSTVGSLTQWFSLEQTAVISRVAALLLLAVGLESLLSVLLTGIRPVLATAALYLGMMAVGNLAGEWIIGGVEGKVFAYGFAFWAAGLAARGCLLRPAALLGCAVSFHPVVGIWCLLATLAGVGIPRLLRGDLARIESLPKIAAAVVLFGVCAAPGLYPALQTLGGAPAEIAAQGDRIQVFSRLKHHLDPAVFSLRAYACYAVMLVVWMAFRKRAAMSAGGDFLHWYLVASVLFAVGGLVARFGFPLLGFQSASLLKFYPFRLFDVLLPLAVAVLVVRLFQQWADGFSELPQKQRAAYGMAYIVCGAAIAYTLLVMPVDRSPTRFHPLVLADWQASCRWASEHAPDDARVLTPSYSWGFKWYGQRVEYVNYKDCPQDAPSLLEWQRRYDLLRTWEESRLAGTMSREIVNRFEDRELIDFVIARTNDETDLPVVYRGQYFSVFDVRRQ